MATKQEIRDYFAKFGKEGGKTRARNMTAEDRAEAARKASRARWAQNDKRIADSLKETKETIKASEEPARPEESDVRVSLTAKDVYDAVVVGTAELGNFVEDYEEGDSLDRVTVDAVVNCHKMAEFLQARWKKAKQEKA